MPTGTCATCQTHEENVIYFEKELSKCEMHMYVHIFVVTLSGPLVPICFLESPLPPRTAFWKHKVNKCKTMTRKSINSAESSSFAKAQCDIKLQCK